MTELETLDALLRGQTDALLAEEVEKGVQLQLLLDANDPTDLGGQLSTKSAECLTTLTDLTAERVAHLATKDKLAAAETQLSERDAAITELQGQIAALTPSDG